MASVDMEKLNSFLGRFVGDLGAAVHAGMVVIGEKLAFYKALAAEPMTSAELAAKTSTDERYVREWLCSQAAGGYVTYNEKTDKFGLTEEQAFTLANEDSPAYLPGAFQLALCTPCSRSQEVALCLGAQSGEKRMREVVGSAGFTRFRRATETPFNIV